MGSGASQKLRRPGGRRRRLGPGIAHSQAWLPELARKKKQRLRRCRPGAVRTEVLKLESSGSTRRSPEKVVRPPQVRGGG